MPNMYALLGWMAVVIVAVGIGVAIVSVVRRWSQREEQIETFTFQDLREMRERGDISEEEFAAMRHVVLSHMATQLSDDAPPPPPRPTPPLPPDQRPPPEEKD